MVDLAIEQGRNYVPFELAPSASAGQNYEEEVIGLITHHQTVHRRRRKVVRGVVAGGIAVLLLSLVISLTTRGTNNKQSAPTLEYSATEIRWSKMTVIRPQTSWADLETVALSGDGDVLAVAKDSTDGSHQGSVVLMRYISGTWTQVTEMHAIDHGDSVWFGKSMALSKDASKLAVGSPGNAEIIVFSLNGDAPESFVSLQGTDADGTGEVLCMSDDGAKLAYATSDSIKINAVGADSMANLEDIRMRGSCHTLPQLFVDAVVENMMIVRCNQVFTMDSRVVLHTVPYEGSMSNIALGSLSADGKMMLIAETHEGLVRLHTWTKQKEWIYLQSSEVEVETTRSLHQIALTLAHDGSTLALGFDTLLHIYSWRQVDWLLTSTIDAASGSIQSVSFSSDASRLAFSTHETGGGASLSVYARAL